MSDSSLADDLQEKADIYAEAGVREYWVVDVNASRIHVLTEAVDGHYRKMGVVHSPATLAPQCLPSAVLATKDLFQVV